MHECNVHICCLSFCNLKSWDVTTKGLLMQHCTKRVEFINLFNYFGNKCLSDLMQLLVEMLDPSRQSCIGDKLL
jgi:hypothetical protein